VIAAVRATDGCGVAVSEEAIAEATVRVARREGMELGPEGAAAFVALETLADRGRLREGDRVVVFQTGDPANYRA
jgi:threonine synthase